MRKKLVVTMLIGMLAAGTIFAGCGKKDIDEYIAKAESGELSSSDLEYIKEIAGEEKASQVEEINEKSKKSDVVGVAEGSSVPEESSVTSVEGNKMTESSDKSAQNQKTVNENGEEPFSTYSAEKGETGASAAVDETKTVEKSFSLSDEEKEKLAKEDAKKAEEARKEAEARAMKEIEEAKTAEQVAAAAQSLAEKRAAQEQDAAVSTDFINYLNQERAAEGLGSIAWDENLADEALRRAEEISQNFSHDGAPAGCGEIIATARPDSSESDWYAVWYGSDGHRANMLNDNYVSGACASTVRDGKRYVVALFSAPAASGHSATPEEHALIEDSMKDAVVVYEDPNTGAQTMLPADSVDKMEQQGIDPASTNIKYEDLSEEQQTNITDAREEALKQLGIQ